MKRLHQGLLLLLILSGGSQRLLALSPRELVDQLKRAKAERMACQRLIEAGEGAGQRLYRHLNRSCPAFLLSGGGYSELFGDAPADWSSDQGCYESGFRSGYVLETVRQWTPCAEQFQRALAQSNEALVKKCEAAAQQTHASLVSLETDLKQALEAQEDPAAIAKLGAIFYWTELSYAGQKAWDELLQAQAESPEEQAVCSIVLANTWKGSAP